MGVPAFYRWLSEKYPKIVVEMLEDRAIRVDGTEIPIDLTAENPNGIEFDNLYIDMNGIIHPCSHPEDKPAPDSEEAMYKNIMDYVDRLFSAVRPRRLLYLAIDGVAPRAKMNQQRSRRFRSAQEAEEAKALKEETRQAMKEMGIKVPPKSTKPPWDSNIITPGTSFMHRLSKYLRFYVQDRVNRDKAWQNIKVILSDASEPGEGEHKIMDFVRRQRAQPGYDPNQHHILHGLDADLIMLGLATHERTFTILREQVLFGRQQREKAEKKQQALQAARDALSGGNELLDAELSPHKPLQMLQLWVLREYLENEFSELAGRVPFGYDFERVVDDFVFLCFFVGNDFLPHLPSLDIRDGAIDYLFNVYKRVIPSLGDYLTASGGVVNLKQVDVIMGEVGEIEDEVFKRRRAAEAAEQARRSGYGGGFRGSRNGAGDGGHHGRTQDFNSHGRHGEDNRRYHAGGGGGGGGGRSGRYDNGSTASSEVTQTGQKGPKVYSLGMATASEKRKAAREAKRIAKDNDDAMKSLAVPIDSVRTDRLKDAKRKLEEGGKTGASWGGGHGDLAKDPGKAAGGARGGDTAGAPEDANKSAAAKLRQKLGSKASKNGGVNAKAAAKLKGRGNKGSRGRTSGVDGQAGGDEENAEADGDGEEADVGAEAEAEAELQPPHKQARFDGQMSVDSMDHRGQGGVENGQAAGASTVENGSLEGGDDEDDPQGEEEGGGDGDGDDDDDDPALVAATEEEIETSKSAMKERVKDKTQAMLDEMKANVEDTVRLGEDGWKDRYYHDKCKLDDIEGGGGRQRLFQTYVEGLCWVMLYYYRGCPSWTWYFPFHYAPFASDLMNCDRFEMRFEESTPFRPIEQLMGVLPSASCAALPKPCRALMTDKNSPIIDFYPKDVKCDPNGKPMPWLWVVLLPFIDEKRLLSNLQPLYSKFTPEEQKRNQFGPSYLFANVRTSLGEAMQEFLAGGGTATSEAPAGPQKMVLSAEEWRGFGGSLEAAKEDVAARVGNTLEAPTQPLGVFRDVPNNQVAVAIYGMPPRGDHICRMLPGVEPLARTLMPEDLVPKRPPRLNRNMSIAEMGTGKYSRNARSSYASSQGAAQRMIRHQIGGSGAPYQGYQTPTPQVGYGQGYGYGFQAQTTGFGGYSTRGYEEQHHMHQPTGNRRWGSQEPTPKRSSSQRYGTRPQHQQAPHYGQQQQQHQQMHQQPAAAQPVYQQAPQIPTPQVQPQPVLYYPIAAPAPAPQPIVAAPAPPVGVYPSQAPVVQNAYYPSAQQTHAPAVQRPAATAYFAVAQPQPQQPAPTSAPAPTPTPTPQGSFGFQHPGYAPQVAPPPAARGAQSFPTMDSLRSKLANALQQTKGAPMAAPQMYTAYPQASAPVSQQAAPVSYYAQPSGVAQPVAAAPATTNYSNQHIRFDESGRPTWGGQPWGGGSFTRR